MEAKRVKVDSTLGKTQKNLAEAFAGESQANRKYLAFAAKAEAEGFPVVARLFRAAAEAETVHALGHLKNMEGIKSTAENLQAAFDGETFEYKEMYPPMLKDAEEEGHKGKVMIKYALEAEEVHAKLYAKALEAVKAGKDLEDTHFFYCPICGHIEEGEAPEKCPICGAAKDRFVQL